MGALKASETGAAPPFELMMGVADTGVGSKEFCCNQGTSCTLKLHLEELLDMSIGRIIQMLKGGSGSGRHKGALKQLASMKQDARGNVKTPLIFDLAGDEHILSVDTGRKDLKSTEENVPLNTLHGLEATVNSKKVEGYIKQKGVENKLTKMPTVVRHNGTDYLIDGNHRAVAAMLKGERNIKARVVHFSNSDV